MKQTLVQRARKLLRVVHILDDDSAIVKSQTNDTIYEVDIIKQKCSCLANRYYPGNCKHIEAVNMTLEKREKTLKVLEAQKIGVAN